MSTETLCEILELGSEGTLLVEFFLENGKIKRIGLKEAFEKTWPEEKRFSPFLLRALTERHPDLSGLLFEISGTSFQKRVWEEVRKIPPGLTKTYGEVAKNIRISSPRAIGQALKQNPLPIIIPCHRVIGKNGSLTGFSAGINIKQMLLNFEKGLDVHEDCGNE